MSIDPQLGQYQIAVMLNESDYDGVVAQATALLAQVDDRMAPFVQAYIDATQAAEAAARTAIMEFGTTPPVVPPVDPPIQHGVNLRATGASAASAKVGVATTLSATFTNDGDTDISATGPAIGVGFFLADGTQVAWAASNAGLKAGASMTLDTTTAVPHSNPWMPTTAGVAQITAKVDDVNRLVELNENDNNVTISVTVAPADVPVTPPGTRPGKRKAQHWGQDKLACSNLPFGNETSFGQVKLVGNIAQFLLTNPWGMTFTGTDTSDELQQPFISGDDENHMVHVQPDKVSAQDSYGAVSSSDRTPRIWGPLYSLKDPPTAANHQGMTFTNMGACGWAHSIGVIREQDVLQGYIGHTLALFGPGGNLSLTAPFIWPAYRADGAWKTAYLGGPFSIGSRAGIPWTTPSLGCTSVLGKLMEAALRTHGAYFDNFAGSVGFKGEATTKMNTWRSELMAAGDAPKLIAAIRNTTNCDINNPAGPALTGRRALLAPDWDPVP